MAVGDIYGMTLMGKVFGNDVQCNFHYRQTDPVSGDPMTFLAQGWESQVGPLFVACVTNQYSCSEIKVRQMGTPVGTIVTVALTGTQTGENIPLNAPPIVSYKTNLIGRRYMGRVFLPPCNEANYNGENVITGQLTAMQTFGLASLVVTNPGPAPAFELVIYHKDDNTGTTVTQAIARPTPGNQRRRRPGVGS